MALVVFLRGVNVGGHRTFRPTTLAAQLKHLDCVNIGAAGTFVIRKPISQAKLRSELAKRLPFETQTAICDGGEILELIDRAPYGPQPSKPDVVRFISVFIRPALSTPAAPMRWPDKGQWLVRVLEIDNRFIVGEYRRNMKTIGYLGGLDKAVSTPVTTRNWSTFERIGRILGQKP
jgi:uncharacterized protein (DUF1697 family)